MVTRVLLPLGLDYQSTWHTAGPLRDDTAAAARARAPADQGEQGARQNPRHQGRESHEQYGISRGRSGTAISCRCIRQRMDELHSLMMRGCGCDGRWWRMVQVESTSAAWLQCLTLTLTPEDAKFLARNPSVGTSGYVGGSRYERESGSSYDDEGGEGRLYSMRWLG